MKMKTKLVSLFLVVLLTVFLGCSEDIYENSTSHSNAQKEKYKISFAQFKREKGIKNFDLLKTIKSTSINAREEGTDKGYVIDTTTIYRYTTQNNKITYSFKIYPIYQTLEDKEYYNLVYEKFGDQWNEIIFKNKEKDSIISGEPKTESSEMLYYKGFNTSITISDFCQTIIYDYHCTQETPFCTPGNCDGCSSCVSESISYWPCEDPTTIDQTIAEPISGSSAGAGSGGNALSGIYIPNPYNGDADINNAEFMLACQVTAYTNLLSQNFPSIGATLTFNPWMHSNIIDFVRNNGNELTPRNQNAIFFTLNNITPIFFLNLSHCTFTEINKIHYDTFQYLLSNPNNDGLSVLNEFITKNNQIPNTFTSIKPFIIEKQIDDNQLDPCSKGVFLQIKNTTNCDFAKILAKLGADNSIYKTTLKTAHNIAIDNGQLVQVTDPANTVRTTQGVKYDYTMFVNPDYTGKTKLYIASLLLHEIAHTYFFSLVDDYNMGAANSFNELPILYNAAVVNHFPINSDLHHEEIANTYVAAIAEALQEFQPGLPLQVYSDLAWSGLEKTDIFNTLYPNGTIARLRILNRKRAEQVGTTIDSGTPDEQIPMGQPCN